jgi:hypothetical protein
MQNFAAENQEHAALGCAFCSQSLPLLCSPRHLLIITPKSMLPSALWNSLLLPTPPKHAPISSAKCCKNQPTTPASCRCHSRFSMLNSHSSYLPSFAACSAANPTSTCSHFPCNSLQIPQQLLQIVTDHHRVCPILSSSNLCELLQFHPTVDSMLPFSFCNSLQTSASATKHAPFSISNHCRGQSHSILHFHYPQSRACAHSFLQMSQQFSNLLPLSLPARFHSILLLLTSVVQSRERAESKRTKPARKRIERTESGRREELKESCLNFLVWLVILSHQENPALSPHC